MNLKFSILVKKCSEIILQIYRRIPMSKCEFNKDVLQYLCGTASETIIFKEHCLMNASIFCSLFKVVHCLSVSITTDTLSKAIMDPSSVQLF